MCFGGIAENVSTLAVRAGFGAMNYQAKRMMNRTLTIMPWEGFVKPTINKMVENQNFGQAIEALKQGQRVARQGWNGKGMFLFLLPAGTVPTKAIHDPALREVIEQEIGGETFEALGSIRMFTADKKILTGWLASQTDILSEDWVIL